MTYKLTFKGYPLMTKLLDTACDWTLEEIEVMAIKQLRPGMTATISYTDNTIVKELEL